MNLEYAYLATEYFLPSIAQLIFITGYLSIQWDTNALNNFPT